MKRLGLLLTMTFVEQTEHVFEAVRNKSRALINTRLSEIWNMTFPEIRLVERKPWESVSSTGDESVLHQFCMSACFVIIALFVLPVICCIVRSVGAVAWDHLCSFALVMVELVKWMLRVTVAVTTVIMLVVRLVWAWWYNDLYSCMIATFLVAVVSIYLLWRLFEADSAQIYSGFESIKGGTNAPFRIEELSIMPLGSSDFEASSPSSSVVQVGFQRGFGLNRAFVTVGNAIYFRELDGKHYFSVPTHVITALSSVTSAVPLLKRGTTVIAVERICTLGLQHLAEFTVLVAGQRARGMASLARVGHVDRRDACPVVVHAHTDSGSALSKGQLLPATGMGSSGVHVFHHTASTDKGWSGGLVTMDGKAIGQHVGWVSAKDPYHGESKANVAFNLAYLYAIVDWKLRPAGDRSGLEADSFTSPLIDRLVADYETDDRNDWYVEELVSPNLDVTYIVFNRRSGKVSRYERDDLSSDKSSMIRRYIAGSGTENAEFQDASSEMTTACEEYVDKEYRRLVREIDELMGSYMRNNGVDAAMDVMREITYLAKAQSTYIQTLCDNLRTPNRGMEALPVVPVDYGNLRTMMVLVEQYADIQRQLGSMAATEQLAAGEIRARVAAGEPKEQVARDQMKIIANMRAINAAIELCPNIGRELTMLARNQAQLSADEVTSRNSMDRVRRKLRNEGYDPAADPATIDAVIAQRQALLNAQQAAKAIPLRPEAPLVIPVAAQGPESLTLDYYRRKSQEGTNLTGFNVYFDPLKVDEEEVIRQIRDIKQSAVSFLVPRPASSGLNSEVLKPKVAQTMPASASLSSVTQSTSAEETTKSPTTLPNYSQCQKAGSDPRKASMPETQCLGALNGTLSRTNGLEANVNQCLPVHYPTLEAESQQLIANSKSCVETCASKGVGCSQPQASQSPLEKVRVDLSEMARNINRLANPSSAPKLKMGVMREFFSSLASQEVDSELDQIKGLQKSMEQLHAKLNTMSAAKPKRRNASVVSK
ncbi:hypothetical protein 1 [Beihai razor shell virus 3]|uniref:hypothetical protein 1 n=1 Tax=Beihai razor shell virus 3 TaxID=1922647 RepID=UPI00090A62BC|nr:hypothetical protein 1 [Beihai razor shell virus 3]APG75689.1 hypothetical protein 1 [Beihai razor shell virus 3]